MPFAAVLAQVGGLGRFQVLQTLLLAVPILLMASHNLLQNFTAAVPPHRCRLPRATPAAASPDANPAAAAEPSGATLRAPEGTAGAPGDNLWASGGALGAPSGTLGTPSATLSSSGATFGSPSATLGAPAGTLGSSDSSLKASGATLSSSGATLSSPGATLSAPGATLGSSGAALTSPDATMRPPGGPQSSPAHPGATWMPLDASQGGHNGSLEPLDASLWGHNDSLDPLDASLGSCWLLVANASGGHGAPEPCREGWDYDLSLYVATIVTEWDLVCGRRQLRQVAQSIYMGGVLVGALLLGGLSDRFGRKALLLWSYLQLGVLGTCTAFAPSYAAYCALRFASGMALSGFGLSIACLVVEWMPTPYRAITVALTGFSYTLGQILLAALAYAVPHWRWLQLTVSLPFFAFFLCSWWLAESARWLVLSGKAKRAVKVLRRVARINGKEEEGEKITVEVLKANMKEELAALKDSYSISDLVRTAVIRHIFCCLSIIWFSISFSYYGLAMDLQHFGVSIYLIQVIFGAVDFPAKLVVTIALSYVGRRLSLMAALLLAGLVLIANIFVPTELQTLRTVLAVLGKGCLSASFNCVFLYTTELYPTPIRQTGLGFGSTMARVGGMVAPLVKMLDEVYPALPPAVYGVAPLVATVAAGFLPETLNTPLPDTIEEVEARAKRKKMKDPKEKIPLQPQEKTSPREA